MCVCVCDVCVCVCGMYVCVCVWCVCVVWYVCVCVCDVCVCVHAFFISALHRPERQRHTIANLGPTEILWTQAGVDNRPGHDAVDKIIYALGE